MRRYLKRMPFAASIIRRYLERRYERRFAGDCYGCFRGVFETFEEAIQSAPRTKSVGYDNEELALEYQQMLEQENWEHSSRLVAPYDYPVMFWLGEILGHGDVKSVFDFGGNVGIHYYGYRKYLEYPETLRWFVCDVPAIVKVGKTIAEKRDCTTSLVFTCSFQDVNGKDVFLASGSVQYVEDLSQVLSVRKKPR